MNVDDSPILRALRTAPDGFCTLEELCKLTSLEEPALSARLDVLRQAGFLFEINPLRGYRLVSTPDHLVGDDIRARMPADAWVREVLVFAETRSTNDVIAKLGDAGAPEGLAIFAEHQTGGRGRFGRKWESERGSGLWFSILARPAVPQSQWSRLTLLCAVAVARGIEAATNLSAAIKWPNDVEIEGKKVCGILAESRGFVTLGMGINVNQRIFPPELADRAISLRMILGQRVDRAGLAAAILTEFGALYRGSENRFDAVLDEFRSRCSLLHRQVCLSSAGRTCEGIAEAIDEEGRLGLRLASGELEWFRDGETTIHPL